MNNFTLWLEYEIMNPRNWHIEHEFCSIQVNLPDGRYYQLHAGTYKYLEASDKQEKVHPRIPDLFVEKLTKDCIENAIRDLLQIGNLEQLLPVQGFETFCRQAIS